MSSPESLGPTSRTSRSGGSIQQQLVSRAVRPRLNADVQRAADCLFESCCRRDVVGVGRCRADWRPHVISAVSLRTDQWPSTAQFLQEVHDVRASPPDPQIIHSPEGDGPRWAVARRGVPQRSARLKPGCVLRTAAVASVRHPDEPPRRCPRRRPRPRTIPIAAKDSSEVSRPGDADVAFAIRRRSALGW